MSASESDQVLALLMMVHSSLLLLLPVNNSLVCHPAEVLSWSGVVPRGRCYLYMRSDDGDIIHLLVAASHVTVHRRSCSSIVTIVKAWLATQPQLFSSIVFVQYRGKLLLLLLPLVIFFFG